MTFPHGKHKVLTMSYDDGRTADRRLVRMFNEYQIKGTFHINSGLLDTGDHISSRELKDLYQGHEVSAHTFTHPTIARSPREEILAEIMDDRRHLERLVGYCVRGLSYPNGSFNRKIKEMLPYLGIEYARTVHSTGNFSMPDDFFEWNPTCHHTHKLMELAESFASLHKKQYVYMMYVWGHSYEFDSDNSWGTMESFCKLISNREEIWYATNVEIADYLNAFSSLRFSASSDFVYNPSVISVWLTVEGRNVEVKGGATVQLDTM